LNTIFTRGRDEARAGLVSNACQQRSAIRDGGEYHPWPTGGNWHGTWCPSFERTLFTTGDPPRAKCSAQHILSDIA